MIMQNRERVQRVAIAMCEADGRNPYEGATHNSGQPCQAWETYQSSANRFLAAYTAAQLMGVGL